MTTDSRDDDAARQLGDDEARDQVLWDLLARGKPVEPSPYFARRVLRDLETGAGSARAEAAAGWRAWLRPRWVLAGSGTFIFLLTGIFAFSPLRMVSRQPAASRQTILSLAAVMPGGAPGKAEIAGDDVSPQDVEVIADLDNLVAREETNVWTDENSRL